MTCFERCSVIRNFILRRAAEVMLYEWDAEFGRRQIKEIPQRLKDVPPVDVCKLTAQQCEELGFFRWNDESELRLIPLWLFPFLLEDIETTCIDGSVCRGRSKMDTENRGGMLAYGILPAAEPEKLNNEG